MNIIDELEWRGAINQQTDAEGLYKLVDKKSISLYCGIDPTGDSMHIGHLIPFMILKRFSFRKQNCRKNRITTHNDWRVSLPPWKTSIKRTALRPDSRAVPFIAVAC